MSSVVFTTVSIKLLEYVESTIDHFKNLGCKVHPEKTELEFPYTPTLVCVRGATTLILEISNKLLDEDKISAWASYGKSCSKDTRFALCLPPKAEIPTTLEKDLRGMGIGLYIVQDDNQLIERIPPRDLALQLQLPQLNSLPSKLRSRLGSAYEQFDRSHWREGFEEVCQVLETEARRYLKSGIKTGRITVMGKSGARNPTSQQIDKMTIGKLADAFTNIQNQNYLDAQIGKTLNHINRDRIGVVHHKSKAKTEKSLRTNVGQHMWAIIGLLKMML